MNNWIKPEDGKPDLNTEVVTASYNGIWFYNLTIWTGKEWISTYENLPCNIDYWMPIPEPPKIQEDLPQDSFLNSIGGEVYIVL